MTKISALSDIGTSVASNDTFVLVDVSDPTTPNKKIQQQNLFLIPDGSVGTPGLRFLNDLDTGIFRNGSNTLALVTGGSSRLYIDSSGRVGLGSSSPAGTLHVQGTNSGGTLEALVLRNSATAAGTATAIRFTNSTSAFNHASIVGTRSGTGALDFYTAGSATPAMSIDSSSRVGVGTTAPGRNLHVAAPSGSGNATFAVERTDATTAALVIGAESNIIKISARETSASSAVGRDIQFESGPLATVRIDTSGRLLVGTSTARQTGAGFTAQSQVEGAGTVSASSFTITSNRSADDLGPRLNFARSKGGSLGSNTIVDADAEYGGIYFFGADGTDTDSIGAQISAYVDGTPAGPTPGPVSMPGRLVFSTTADGASSPTERMRIQAGGGVMTYTDFTTALNLTVAGAASATDRGIDFKHSGGGVNSGTRSFQVTTNGDVKNTNNSYGAISDAKLKENIVDANTQWHDLRALRIRNYNFKSETNQQTHTQLGLIAQEVELVSPGLVSESPDLDAEGNDLGTVTKSVNYSVLYMKAVKALQEAMERIETLEAKVAALETP